MPIQINKQLPIVDFDKVPYEGTRREKIPNGWYNCAVTDVVITTKNDEDCIIVTSSITNGDYQGRSLLGFYYIFTRLSNRGKFKYLVRTLGLTNDELTEMAGDPILFNVLMGLNFQGYVKTDTTFTNLVDTKPANPEFNNGDNILSKYKENQEMLDRIIEKEDTEEIKVEFGGIY